VSATVADPSKIPAYLLRTHPRPHRSLDLHTDGATVSVNLDGTGDDGRITLHMGFAELTVKQAGAIAIELLRAVRFVVRTQHSAEDREQAIAALLADTSPWEAP